MRTRLRLPSALLFVAGLVAPAVAQEEIPFADGTITIAENADYEKIITFNGQEIGRDYMVFFDRIAEIQGTEVALISVGPGGNACGANTLMVWPDGEGGVKTDKLPGDCGWPAASVSDYQILFVPWVGPGEEAEVRSWTPEEGFAMAGMLRFAPEPDTAWDELARTPMVHPLEYFYNAAFFEKAGSILGDDLYDYALGLRVASEMEPIGDSFYAGTGCVPHDCGGADSLLVVDFNIDGTWFAQKRGETITYWPDKADWPEAALDALHMLGQ